MKALLIACLGNPGEKYAQTRHNVGFMAANAWVQKVDGTWRNRYRGLLRTMIYVQHSFRARDTEILVIKPHTYMNRSGDAVVHALKNLSKMINAEQTDIIAVADEYNFPIGRVHLKYGGSSGGHNGIQSLITALGTEGFWRLRCGIGREFGPGGLTDYVLSPFTPAQNLLVPTMIEKACSSLNTIVDVGADRAMNIINTSA